MAQDPAQPNQTAEPSQGPAPLVAVNLAPGAPAPEIRAPRGRTTRAAANDEAQKLLTELRAVVDEARQVATELRNATTQARAEAETALRHLRGNQNQFRDLNEALNRSDPRLRDLQTGFEKLNQDIDEGGRRFETLRDLFSRFLEELKAASELAEQSDQPAERLEDSIILGPSRPVVRPVSEPTAREVPLSAEPRVARPGEEPVVRETKEVVAKGVTTRTEEVHAEGGLQGLRRTLRSKLGIKQP